MDITRCLTISTAHIKKSTADMVDAEEIFDMVVYKKDEFGWWIVTAPNILRDPDVPSDLKACIKLALKYDCEWLCLDRDGDYVASLPSYDWE